MYYDFLYNIWISLINYYLFKNDYDLEFLMIHSQYD